MNIGSTFPIASKELLLSFKLRKPYPGGRDFLWLILLLTLLFIGAFSVLLVYRGFNERLLDVLLGHIPNGGTPVWVRPRISFIPTDQGTPVYIDEALIESLRQQAKYLALQVYPHKEVGASGDFSPQWPSEETWSKDSEVGFKGLAVLPDDPLWKDAVKDKDIKSPLHLVLNRSLFDKEFHSAQYRIALEGKIPGTLFKQLPVNGDKEHWQKMESLWMKVGKTLLPVNITWVDNFPIPRRYSFLMSMELYYALMASDQYNLSYYPEATEKPGERVTAVNFLIDRDYQRAHLEALSDCLNTPFPSAWQPEFRFNIASGTEVAPFELKLKTALPKIWVAACLSNTDYRVETTSGISINLAQELMPIDCKTLFRWTNDRANCKPDQKVNKTINVIRLPCDKMPQGEITANEMKQCEAEGASISSPLLIKSDQHLSFKPYQDPKQAFLYVANRSQVTEIINLIDKMHDTPLIISETYNDTLKRFNFLTRLLDSLGIPMIITISTIGIFILGLQLSSIIGHRTHIYGIFLTKGLSTWNIYTLFLYQLAFSLLVGFSVAMGIIYFIRLGLEKLVHNLALGYQDIVNLPENIFSLGWYESISGLVIGGFVLMALALVIILVYVPIKATPARLMKVG